MANNPYRFLEMYAQDNDTVRVKEWKEFFDFVVKTTGKIIGGVPVASCTHTAKTADYTVLAADFGNEINNTGDAGAIVFTLPAASTVAWEVIRFDVIVAQQMSISPAATEGINFGGSAVVDKDLVIAANIGSYVEIYSDGSDYHVSSFAGVITKEA